MSREGLRAIQLESYRQSARNPKRYTFYLALFCASIQIVAGCGGGGSVSPPGPIPEVDLGIPLAYTPAAQGFGYPASEQTLATYLAHGDVAAMRAHGWDVWAALTAPSSSHVPVMLTWYQNSEIFGAGTIAQPRTFVPRFLAGPPDSLGEGDPPISLNV